jgi:DNA mismatch repair protein MSH2
MDEIKQRQDVVEAFTQADGLLRQVEGFFRHVPDLEKVANRFHRLRTPSKWAKASLEDMVTLYQCVANMQQLLTALGTYEGVHSAVLTGTVTEPLRSCLADFKSFRALVEQTVDLVQAEQRTFCISTAFDATLKDLGAQRDKIREQMEALREKVNSDIKLATKGAEKGVALAECPDGQCFRVTKKFQQVIQSHKGKYKLDILSIKKQECMFTTPDMKKLNAQFQAALDAYDKQSKQLSDKALSVAATYTPVMEKLAELLGNLDATAALARVVLIAPCQFCRAKTDPDAKTFNIKGASHILVVANSEKSFVANDLSMERDSSRLHIITGPNMGGKSTYIRSVALIALLNQIGSFVPCHSATLPIFDSVMCRVGASDMQLRGISTFMAEMLEAASILNTATDRSLVIVDELGRGTSTSDGFGIAWAIARHLAENTRCFTLFATHFHELAGLEDVTSGVHNRHATASVDTSTGRLTFLYALASGPADQSYGAHVAELAGFPKEVVDASRTRATEFEASGDFGRRVKRRRTGEPSEKEASSNAVGYVMTAQTEDDFVSRALEHLPHFRKAVAGVSENGG